MKNNPERTWSIQYWGDRDDDYQQVNFRGTLDQALSHADEEECELDYQVVRMSIIAIA